MKHLLTWLQVLLLCGFAFSVWYEVQRTGLAKDAQVEKLRGDGSEFSEPMALETMAAITHPHVTALPLLLAGLVAPFCFGMRWPAWLKHTLVACAFGGCALGLLSHWLVRYLGPGWHWSMTLSGIALVAGAVAPPVLAIMEMWGRPPATP